MPRQPWMRRFDFDPEAVVRMCWAGVWPINRPATVRYLSPDEGGVSHFNYLRDNILLTWMHTRLVLEFAVRLPFLLARRLSGPGGDREHVTVRKQGTGNRERQRLTGFLFPVTCPLSSHSAVDRDDLPRDVACSLGAQKADEIRDLVGRARTLHRHDALDRRAVERPVAHRRIDDAWCDGVDRDAP